MKAINSKNAPAPIGPYSQAIFAAKELFCSGQVGLDPTSGNLAGDDVASQTDRALKNLGAVLEAGGLSYEDVVKTTIYLVSMDDYAAVNEVYARYFSESKPARSTVAVSGLPRNAKIEIDAIARK